jgi:sugar-specific transcriptional regulator TrmB
VVDVALSEIKRLLEELNRFFEVFSKKKCVCVDAEEYNKIVNDINEAIKKLEEWIRRAEAGELGAERVS